MERKTSMENLSENSRTGVGSSVQQDGSNAKNMKTDLSSQIGDADSWLD